MHIKVWDRPIGKKAIVVGIGGRAYSGGDKRASHHSDILKDIAFLNQKRLSF